MLVLHSGLCDMELHMLLPSFWTGARVFARKKGLMIDLAPWVVLEDIQWCWCMEFTIFHQTDKTGSVWIENQYICAVNIVP